MKIFDELKWAIQRVYRGWDDRVIWSIDWYLAKMIPIWLQRLKEEKHGNPPLVIDGHGKTDFEESEIRWEEILDIMIEGFEAAFQILENDFDAWDELHEEENRRFGRMLLVWDEEDAKELDRLYTKLDFRRKLREQQDEATNRFREGMELFSEHFFSLWD